MTTDPPFASLPMLLPAALVDAAGWLDDDAVLAVVVSSDGIAR